MIGFMILRDAKQYFKVGKEYTFSKGERMFISPFPLYITMDLCYAPYIILKCEAKNFEYMQDDISTHQVVYKMKVLKRISVDKVGDVSYNYYMTDNLRRLFVKDKVPGHIVSAFSIRNLKFIGY